MNEIIHKLLLGADKFMPKMHLRQPTFTTSARDPFTNNKKIIKKFKEPRDVRYSYHNKLDKACFQHDMTYRDSKDLNRRTAA